MDGMDNIGGGIIIGLFGVNSWTIKLGFALVVIGIVSIKVDKILRS